MECKYECIKMPKYSKGIIWCDLLDRPCVILTDGIENGNECDYWEATNI